MEKYPRLINRIGKKNQLKIDMRNEKRKNENGAEKRNPRIEDPKTSILKKENRMMQSIQVRQACHYLLKNVKARNTSIPND